VRQAKAPFLVEGFIEFSAKIDSNYLRVVTSDKYINKNITKIEFTLDEVIQKIPLIAKITSSFLQ